MLFFLIAILFLIIIALFIVYSVLKYTNSKDWAKKWFWLYFSIDDVRAVFRLKKEPKKEDKAKNE